MALGDIKTFLINQGGLILEVDAIDMGGGKTQFVVRCIEGYADINALYWGDGDKTANEGDYFNAASGAEVTSFPSSLNMNGTKVAWDGGAMLSSPGLGPAGTDKASYITAGETLNAFTLDVDWATISNLGVRATSTSTPEGSIKGVDCSPDVTTAPKISVDDAACVVEGGKSIFTVSLDKAYDYDITITYETQGGTATEGDDYTGKTGTVTIKAGQTSATIEIETIDDDDVEGDVNEHYTLVLTKAEVNLDEDADIELDLTTKIDDGDGEGCIVDNDEDEPPPPPDDHFPEWGSPSISHVTFYFDTPDGFVGDTVGITGAKGANAPDGWFTVKFNDEATPELSDDLDDWYDDALAYIIAQNPTLDPDTLVGVSIKGGTTEVWYDIDNDPDDDDSANAPDVWIVENKEVDQAYDVTVSDPFTVA